MYIEGIQEFIQELMLINLPRWTFIRCNLEQTPPDVDVKIQEFIPTYLLRGLIPAALLRSHDFWQDTGESCRCGGVARSAFMGLYG